MKTASRMLADAISGDSDNFFAFESYMFDHSSDVVIDPKFTQSDYMMDRIAFYRTFEERYPGNVYGAHIKFEDMDNDLKLMYCKWYQEFWILRFEDAVKSFNLSCAYFVHPMDDGSHVVYMVEKLRDGNFSVVDY